MATFPGQALRAVSDIKFRKFAEAVERYIFQHNDLNIKIRTENNIISFFCADETVIDDLVKRVPEFIDVVYKPKDTEALEYLLKNNRKVLAKALPYGKYRYKITLRENMPSDDRDKFYTWVNKFASDDLKSVSYTHLTLPTNREV